MLFPESDIRLLGRFVGALHLTGYLFANLDSDALGSNNVQDTKGHLPSTAHPSQFLIYNKLDVI